MQKPEVSIVIVSWNACEITLACLRSLEICQKRVPLEIILSDNGSCDGTIFEVRRKYPEVRLVENGRNLGFAMAVNKGAKKATAPMLLLLNNDTRLSPQALETMLQQFKSNPKLGVVGPQLIYEDGRLQNSVAAIPNLSTELINKTILKKIFPEKFPDKHKNYDGLTKVPSVIGACLMTRKELFEQLNGLDEAYFFFLEETDYCLRAAKEGFFTAICPNAKVEHLQGYSAKKVEVKVKIEYHRSLFTFFKHHHGDRQIRILRIGLFAEHAFKLCTTSVALLLTLFIHLKLRTKWLTYVSLLMWQLKGCPEKYGLKKNA